MQVCFLEKSFAMLTRTAWLMRKNSTEVLSMFATFFDESNISHAAWDLQSTAIRAMLQVLDLFASQMDFEWCL
jgi:hypothetical protein